MVKVVDVIKVAYGKELNDIILTLKDKDDNIRKAAIVTLSELGDKRALESLKDLRLIKKNKEAKELIKSAINKIGTSKQIYFIIHVNPRINHVKPT